MITVDTHIHLNDEAYQEDWHDLVKEAKAAGIGAFIVPGTDVPTSQRAVNLSLEETSIIPAVGLHPHEADQLSEKALEDIRKLFPQAVAIGEIGLDYHYSFASHEQQLLCLKSNLALAREADLPVILHIREADTDMLSLLAQEAPLPRGGVVHCCSSNWETAQKYLQLGFYIGITGMVTFPKLKSIAEIAAKCPQDRLLIETDGPYLAPIPHRGQRLRPVWIKDTLAYIAGLRGQTCEVVAEFTTKNACNLFGNRLSKVVDY